YSSGFQKSTRCRYRGRATTCRAGIPPPSPPVSSSSSPRMIWICQMSNKRRFDLDASGCENRRSGDGAISRGVDTAELAKKLGAHHYIDSSASDPAAALQALGGAKVILITASGGKTVAATFKGLRPGGVSIVLGVGPEPIETSSLDLIF